MAYGLLYDFYYGQTIDAYQYFGAHFVKQGRKKVSCFVFTRLTLATSR